MTRTPVSLLEPLRSRTDQEAWGRFVEIYGPLIYRWIREFDLQHSDPNTPASPARRTCAATIFVANVIPNSNQENSPLASGW